MQRLKLSVQGYFQELLEWFAQQFRVVISIHLHRIVIHFQTSLQAKQWFVYL